MYRLTSLFLLAFSVLQVNAASWEYVDCGLPSHPLQIDSIALFPDPPLPGQDLTVTVKALVTESIEEGASAAVTVKLGLIKLLQKTFDVCEEARNANATVSCPVEPGPYEVVQTVALPNEIPKAKFVILVRGFTVAEEDMMCLDLKIDFMPSMSSIFNSPFST
ncbi:ML domain-containing protein [Mycena maculata]|uniref:Phosphatidylglycerol/phosphatidylinositol transfer protein n=1 Tax=Mycena maculata TaxID=230809 RepID=A0AAD7P1D7_9AGAR|nr:ML domain-containing protein [Mycena maculata]